MQGFVFRLCAYTLGAGMLSLGGCADAKARRDGPQFQELYPRSSSQPSIWVDNDTGCQYVQAGFSYVLRYTIDGKPWCGLPTPQQRGRPAGVPAQ